MNSNQSISMSKRIAGLLGSLCLVAVILSVAFVTGCDEAKDIRVLTVTPENIVLSGTSNTVVFTVDATTLLDLSLPLVWSVSDPANGAIVGAGGNRATYSRTGLDGVNVITVRDQFDAAGTAIVDQQ
jgi:hypothetical protein